MSGNALLNRHLAVAQSSRPSFETDRRPEVRANFESLDIIFYSINFANFISFRIFVNFFRYLVGTRADTEIVAASILVIGLLG